MERIYFATNRRPNRKVNPTDFGKKFSDDGLANLRFGVAEVDGAGITIKLALERLTADASGFGTDSHRSTFGSLRVFGELREEMRRKTRDTVIFIHGYNVNFAQGVRHAAELSRSLAAVNDGRGVNMALFSWPSDGSMAPWIAYTNDRSDAAASGTAFARGILKLAEFLRSASRQEACRQRLHLVAHSMGNFVLRHALQAIIRCTSSRVPRVFDQILLVAADEDDDAFEHDYKLKVLPRLGKRVHVYFNREDLAMAVSDVTKGNPDRLGDDGARAPSLLPGKVTQIDCTRVVDGFAEHSYHVGSQTVVTDIVAVLSGVEPEDVPGRTFRSDRNCYVILDR